jgi:Cyclin, N-terminal domain
MADPGVVWNPFAEFGLSRKGDGVRCAGRVHPKKVRCLYRVPIHKTREATHLLEYLSMMIPDIADMAMHLELVATRTLCHRHQTQAGSLAKRWGHIVVGRMANPPPLVVRALQQLVEEPVSEQMICHLAQKAIEVEQRVQLLSNPLHAHEPPHPQLTEFITTVVQQSYTTTKVLIPSLVYLAKLASRPPRVAIPNYIPPPHLIFLGSLIIAAKTFNDHSPRNKHWARYASVFGYEGLKAEHITLVEMELLDWLDWKVTIGLGELCLHLKPYLQRVISNGRPPTFTVVSRHTS